MSGAGGIGANAVFTVELNELICKHFRDDLTDWIDFVCRCRDGGTDYLQYDLIEGKAANDKVFCVADLYHAGIWEAMDLYYRSKLADKLYLEKNGIQYLDYKVLVQILLETEKGLFDSDFVGMSHAKKI